MSEILYPPRIKALNYNRASEYPEEITSTLNLLSNITSAFVGGHCDFFLSKEISGSPSLYISVTRPVRIQLNESLTLSSLISHEYSIAKDFTETVSLAFIGDKSINAYLNESLTLSSSFIGGHCEFFAAKNIEESISLTTNFDNVLDVQIDGCPVLNQSFIRTTPLAPDPILINPGIKSIIKSDNVIHGEWIDDSHWPMLFTLDAELFVFPEEGPEQKSILSERMIGLHANLSALPTLEEHVSAQKEEAGPESGLRSPVKPLVEAINFYSWMGTIPYTHLVEETLIVSEYLRDLTVKIGGLIIEGEIIYATPTVECFFEIQNRFGETINVSETVDAEFGISMEHLINVFPAGYANVIHSGAVVGTPFEDSAGGIKSIFKPIVEAINFGITYITIPDSWKVEAILNMPARVSVKLDDTFCEFVTINETLTVLSNFGRYADQTLNVSETLYSELNMAIETQINQSMSLDAGAWRYVAIQETTLPYKTIIPSVNYDRAWLGDTPHDYPMGITMNESMIMRVWFERTHYINGGIVIEE